MNETKELNTYLKLLAHLKEKDLATQRLMVLEGRIVIEKALQAGIVPRLLVCTEAEAAYWHQRADNKEGFEATDFPLHVMSHEELCSLVDFKFHHGAIALADMPKLAPFDIAQVLAPLNKKESLDPALKKCSFFLCLWDVTDPSNVGALVRTAAGLGVDGVLVGPGCANPFYRKAIRASMGNAFTLPLWSVDVHGLEKLTQNGALLIAAALDENSMAIDRVNSKDTLLKAVASPQNALIILVLGNEGYGLPPEVLALSAIHVRIPMERGVDSLNVAVAGGILMYEIIRAKG